MALIPLLAEQLSVSSFGIVSMGLGEASRILCPSYSWHDWVVFIYGDSIVYYLWSKDPEKMNNSFYIFKFHIFFHSFDVFSIKFSQVWGLFTQARYTLSIYFIPLVIIEIIRSLKTLTPAPRDGMGREVGGGFGMGNTCTPMADSCQCMAKPIQYCKVNK